MVRIDTYGCEGERVDTGFLVSTDLIATAAHVFDGDPFGRVTRGDQASGFIVVAIDRQRDLALLWADVPVGGEHLTISSTEPVAGQAVATIGYSLGNNLSIHDGVINGLDRKETLGDQSFVGLIEHNAESLIGDNGAPLVDMRGDVLGVQLAGTLLGDDENIEQADGLRFAAPASDLARMIEQLEVRSPVALEGCRPSLGFEGPLEDADLTDDDIVSWLTLQARADAINRGDWEAARATYLVKEAPDDLQSGSSASRILYLSPEGFWKEGRRQVIWVTFTAEQPTGKGPKGRVDETCTQWSFDYLFEKQSGLWLISGTRPHEGVPVSKPADGGACEG